MVAFSQTDGRRYMAWECCSASAINVRVLVFIQPTCCPDSMSQ